MLAWGDHVERRKARQALQRANRARNQRGDVRNIRRVEQRNYNSNREINIQRQRESRQDVVN